MARGGELQDLRQEKKRKKFVRLVVLLTIRKHGVGFILSLFFGFLLATAISAVDDIWTEFQRFQSCQVTSPVIFFSANFFVSASLAGELL